MSAKGEIVTIDELQILLNMIGDHMTISYPPYGQNIFSADRIADGYRLSMKTTPEEIRVSRQKFGDIAEEMPTYNDLSQAFIASGLAPYTNIDKFVCYVQHLQKAFTSKNVYYCPDTNTFYHRFFTTLDHLHPGLIPHHKIILVDTIRQEIDARLNQKYSACEIELMSRTAITDGKLFQDLKNKRKRQSRKAAFLARSEYQMLDQRAGVHLHSVRKSSSDKEDNDRIIIETLSTYESEKHSIVVFLTADQIACDLCKSQGIEHFCFTMPWGDICPERCSAELLRRSIFMLAKVFGFIRVGGVVIHGEFSDRCDDHSRYVKLTFTRQDLAEAVHRDVRICRKLINMSHL